MALTEATLYLGAIFLVHGATADDFGAFPPLMNLARQASLDVASSTVLSPFVTCGQPTPTSFCRSWSTELSLSQCAVDLCNQTCPFGSLYESSASSGSGGSSSFVSLLTAPKYGSCKAGGTSDGMTQVDFSDGCSALLPTNQDVSLGFGSAFTLVGWILLKPGTDGTIVSKRSTLDSATIFIVLASEFGFSLKCRHSSGYSEVTFYATLNSSAWHFFAIQVYDTVASLFLNGTGGKSTPFATTSLNETIADENGWVTIGQNGSGGQQFLGSLKEVRFYPRALSNREIDSVYSLQLAGAAARLAECLCPGSHPRINPLSPRYCVSNNPASPTADRILRLNVKSHPLWYITDADLSTAWISANVLADVVLTLYLGDTFQVFHVVAQFYSPLPAAVEIQRQPISGGAYLSWQFYAIDCSTAFEMKNNGPLDSPTSVNCLQLGTVDLTVPPSSGNITFSALASKPVARPGYNNFYGTSELQEFVKTAGVRLRLNGHSLNNVVSPDLHAYYGIYEVVVTGRCDCNGHADSCDTSSFPYSCDCRSDSYTTGPHCDTCLPLYNNKPFRRGVQFFAYPCQPCQCYNHSDSCLYSAEQDPSPTDHYSGGGGICQLCKHNTSGRNCEQCLPLYYRSISLTEIANESANASNDGQSDGSGMHSDDPYLGCLPCGCNAEGTVGGSSAQCNVTGGGQCPCKPKVYGRRCDRCLEPGYYLDGSSPNGCIRGGGASNRSALASQFLQAALPIEQQSWFVGVVVAGSVLLVAAVSITAVVTGVRHHRRAKAAALASSSGRGDGSQIERSRSSSIASFDPRAELAGVSTLTYGSWASSGTPSRVSLREALLAQSHINAAFSHLPAAQQYAASPAAAAAAAVAARQPTVAAGSVSDRMRFAGHSAAGGRSSRRHIIDASDDDSSAVLSRALFQAGETPPLRLSSSWGVGRGRDRDIGGAHPAAEDRGRSVAADPSPSATWESHGPDSGVCTAQYGSENEDVASRTSGDRGGDGGGRSYRRRGRGGGASECSSERNTVLLDTRI